MSIIRHWHEGRNAVGTRSAQESILFENAPAPLERVLEQPGIPRFGDAYSAQRPDLLVNDVQAEPLGLGHAQITVSYAAADEVASAFGERALGDSQVELATESLTEETIFDVNGVRLVTRYIAGLAFGIGGSAAAVVTQTHRVQLQRQAKVVIVTRLEGDPPWDWFFEFNGKVNSVPFLRRPARHWLLDLSSAPAGDGRHDVRYRFVLSDSSWDAELRHVSSGFVPNDASDGNGIERRPMYETADFARLALPGLVS